MLMLVRVNGPLSGVIRPFPGVLQAASRTPIATILPGDIAPLPVSVNEPDVQKLQTIRIQNSLLWIKRGKKDRKAFLNILIGYRTFSFSIL